MPLSEQSMRFREMYEVVEGHKHRRLLVTFFYGLSREEGREAAVKFWQERNLGPIPTEDEIATTKLRIIALAERMKRIGWPVDLDQRIDILKSEQV